MKKKHGFILMLLLPFIIASVYELLVSDTFRKETPRMSARSITFPQPRIPVLYEDIDSRDMPAIVPLNDEQRAYVVEVLSAMVRVIVGSSTLEMEEGKAFGPGQFHWPKNPDEPVRLSKLYFGQHFRMAGFSARISRESENSPWMRFGMSVHPRNFPRGVFSMKLPPSVFKEFELQKVVQEERSGQRIEKPIVFYFKHKNIKNVVLKVEAREDVASTSDSLPFSLHALQILSGP